MHFMKILLFLLRDLSRENLLNFLLLWHDYIFIFVFVVLSCWTINYIEVVFSKYPKDSHQLAFLVSFIYIILTIALMLIPVSDLIFHHAARSFNYNIDSERDGHDVIFKKPSSVCFMDPYSREDLGIFVESDAEHLSSSGGSKSLNSSDVKSFIAKKGGF